MTGHSKRLCVLANTQLKQQNENEGENNRSTVAPILSEDWGRPTYVQKECLHSTAHYYRVALYQYSEHKC